MSPVSSSLSLPDKLEDGGSWYFSRKELDENSPSRRDGVDLKKEAYLRKSYCTFLQDLGMKLKVPQVTIATAIIFCHRYYLRQSHAKNDGKTIATACMFLAGKVEETPRPLKDVILVSFEIMNKKDPAAIQKIKQKEVYEQQKELILLAERVVLATLAFDLNVQHPYKPLVEAIKKFKVAQNALAQVAWNFVNDGLRTSLCLQFRPHHIAAGAIFLAAKFLKVKLPSDGEKVWWQEFDVTPRQLEEVSNQMLELYEQNKVPPSQANEAGGSTVGGTADQGSSKASKEEQGGHANSSLTEGPSISGTLKPTHSYPETVDNQSVGHPRSTQNHSSDHGSSVVNASYNKGHGESKASGSPPHHVNMEEVHDMTSGLNRHDTEDHKEKGNVVKRFDEDKLKQLREKRRKSRGEAVRRVDSIDEYDPIVKELEEGVELAAAAENEKSKHLRNETSHHSKGHMHELDVENVEEGEVSAFENSDIEPQSSDRKRKAGSPIESMDGGKKWRDYDEDRSKLGRHAYADREHKRHVQENHV